MQLTRTDVVDAAVALLDEYGLADLSMRRLATSLGVAPGALYWHVANKQALLGAVADRILLRAAATDLPAEDEWDARLLAVADALRDALLSHRDGAEVVAASLAARQVSVPIRDRLAEPVRAAGLAEDEADPAALAVLHFVLGATTDEQSRMQLDSLGALPDDEGPVALGTDAAAGFALGLTLFVDGIRHRVRTLER
ncbi:MULTISPECIES: TetR/AcrR family transcriptional regulator C-terminal domain-containing protein [Nocardiaceae]|uniref:TetR/AcrR family transcriptional regulator C-terminal domain-containing protein n=1 Tax=Rhodococcoides kroppenstedtii TaxID=293050 RepID=A0ABS7NXR2_9NOCA|nr:MULTISPECIES: TetR/AcrR family transcriptional regulator C-terminal domain-containing protein [Rhodococcus]AMY19310.1 Tetracycline repressor protein class B from transposon Tn10 [Rhodococcus sp. PBTS 1]MBY6314536.1 TetR/AcrR family transcriptional regulator C-terminal domain-containing protein [Rhodococcus kroppenstedtii]MBY6322343.1 TetR/AcrR family transcriptional regulator C-terminal domain-containing protein [Rhodococcus kroppenstedtii]MBY6401162.1 TetR/AcrR family transcriptional regula